MDVSSIEDDEAVQRVKERFSPEQRARIDQFLDGLSEEQIRSIVRPMTETQRETLLLLMLESGRDIHPVDRMWLDDRLAAKARSDMKASLIAQLKVLLDVAGATTAWSEIESQLIGLSEHVLFALVYRVERARGDAFDEGVDARRRVADDVDGRRREEGLQR